MVDGQDRAPERSAREALGAARRLVVKIGSSLFAPQSGFSPAGLGADIAALRARGGEAVIVSSGAVASGRGVLPGLSGGSLAERQALSAIGQARLMRRWEEALAESGLTPAQVLLTPDVTDDRARYLNARGVIATLLGAGAVPVVNENDAVATEELRFGDNDGLAARTAGLIGADLLILLSDVEGLYSADPRRDPGAALVARIEPGGIGAYRAVAGGAGSAAGTGGMASKLGAAGLAAGWGVPTLIASGRADRPIQAIERGKPCTLVEAQAGVRARRRWLSGVAVRQGEIAIDEGAAKALEAGKSLLKVGILRIAKPFREGEVVEISHDGRLVAFGLARRDSSDLAAEGTRTVVHRDDLVLWERKADD